MKQDNYIKKSDYMVHIDELVKKYKGIELTKKQLAELMVKKVGRTYAYHYNKLAHIEPYE